MIPKALQYLCLLFFTYSLASAQSLNQISFVAFNADGGDDFAFVALSPIAANTTIYFTDNEIVNDSTLNSGEGILAWTNSSLTPAGAIIVINDASSSTNLSASAGIINSVSGNFNLSGSGDALLAYLGPNENEVSQWLSAIENSNNEAGNIASTDLVQNQAYIQFNQTSSPDGGFYQGLRSGENSFSNYRSFIQDPTNWQEEVSNGTAILPISTTAFSTLSSSSTQVLIKNFSDSLNNSALQGDSLHLISDFRLIALNNNTTILNVSIPFSGSMLASDFQIFQLREFSNSSGANTLATLAGDSLINDTLRFANLNQGLTAGDTLIIQLFATIDSNANVSHGFQIGSPQISLSQGQLLDSIQHSFSHQILTLKPQVLISHFNYTANLDSLKQGSSNHAIHAFQINSQFKPSSLLSLNAFLQGSFQTTDITFFKLWSSSDNTFNSIDDQLISVCNYIDTNGGIEFTAINQSLIKNRQNHFFISVDLNCSAQIGNSFRLVKMDSSNFKFDRSVEISGDAAASASIVITELQAQNVDALSYQVQGTSLNIAWTLPSCFDEVVVFIHNQAFNDSIYGQFIVNSNSYLDSTNSTLSSGARAVYAGTSNSLILGSLDAGQHYYLKVFTRSGNKWSSGESFDFLLANSPALIISQYYEGQSNDKWVEISNVGDTAIDLSSFYLGRWSNTSQPIASASSSNQLSGVLAAGNSMLMQHSSASNPLYASGTSGGALAFNGDDALAICSNSAEWENRIDCIYGQGNWGENTSFYRKAWVLNPQRNVAILNGTGEWVEVSNTAVDTASIGSSARLGEHQSGLATGDFTFNGSIWLPQNPQGISTVQNTVVIQSGQATINADVSCSNLQVLHQAKLDINNGAALRVEDSIVNNGEITLSEKASILQNDSASINVNSGVGSYRIKRTYQATATDRFKFWASPIADAHIESSFANSNPLDRYYYQAGGQNSGYRSYINGKMKAGWAYAVTPNLPLNPQLKNFNDSVVFQGDTLNNGTITLQMDSLNPGDFIFLGNPYPSPIDFDLFLVENNNINGSIWFWDASPDDKGNSAFAVWNNQGAVPVGNSKKASPSNIIPSMQGFIIRAGQNIASNSQHTFIFKNSMRIAPPSSNHPFYKNKSANQKLPLRLRSNQAESLCLVALDSSATQLFEESVDAPIYKANQNQSFYSIANQKELSIQAVNSKFEGELIIPLGVDAWHTGNYSIILDSTAWLESHLSVTLIDSLTAFERDLKSQAYSFVINQTGIDTTRFYLKLTKEEESYIGINPNEYGTFFAYQNQKGQLEIDLSDLDHSFNELQLLNLKAQLIESWPLGSSQKKYVFTRSNNQEGIFILKISSHDGNLKTLKIFLRKS